MRAASGLGRVVARASSIRPQAAGVLRAPARRPASAGSSCRAWTAPCTAGCAVGGRSDTPTGGCLPPLTSQYRAPGPSRASRWPSSACWKPRPRSPRAGPPAPERRGPVRPRAQPLHGVVQRPAERGLADDVPAVAGHAPGHVGPAGDDREQLAALDDGDPVALLEPQRAQDARRPAAACRRDAWCARPASPAPGRRRACAGSAAGRAPAGGWRSRPRRSRRRLRRAGRRRWWRRRTRRPAGGCRTGSHWSSRISGRPGRAARLPSLPPLRKVGMNRNLLIRRRSSCAAPRILLSVVESDLSNGAQVPGRATPTRPPRHLADLDPAERRAAAAELGGPPFRADQLARHYFARLTDDPADMTDLPAASRDELAGRAAAPAAHRRAGADLRRGDDPQDAVAGLRRRARRVRPDALPAPGHHVRVLAGGLRDGLPVLRHRPGRADQEPVRRRDRRPGGRGRAGAGPRRGARRPGTGLQRRVHGHGRAAGQLRAAC